MPKHSQTNLPNMILCVLVFAHICVAQVERPPLTAPAGNTAPDQKCTLQGRVTNLQTGAPVKKATVRLVRHQTESGAPFGQQGYSGTSDSDGSFHFEGVEPGDYNLSGDRSGFLTTQFGAAGPRQAGTRLTLRPGQHLTDLTLALTPQGTISGRVIDEDGDPVGGVMVQALGQSWTRRKLHYFPYGGANTDDRGEFRISTLQPGKYFIFCQKTEMMGANDEASSPDKPDIRPVRTFYPDATSRDAAAQVQVKAGQDLAGIDIRLRTAQTHHVRGKVVGELPESDPQRLMLNIVPQDSEMPMFFGARTSLDKSRNFDLAGVAPGAYTLSLVSMNGRFRSFGRQSIDVGASDLDGVILTIIPGGSVHGRIQVEGTPSSNAGRVNLAQIRPFLMPADSVAFYGGSNPDVKADGAFTMPDVSPGKYFVQARNGPEGAYLKSVRFGQQEVLGKEIDFTQGASAEINIVFQYGAATITGTLQGAKGNSALSDSSAAQSAPAATAQVVIVPDVLDDDGSGLHFANADQYGAFTVKGLAPGRYRAFAFEQLDNNQLQNPAVLKQLESKGVELELKERDQKQIRLPVIPKSDSDQLLASLGIDTQ